MTIINAFNAVGVAGMSRTLQISEATAAAAHHGAAIAPRKPRNATAIVASVNRGIT
ncbi:hypothetical protein [Mycolicibacterium agri]|uniref:Uncharacterized protein n=1 Tax=Mycolicibacterium agri TaxID=36811 RepID=A0A7I9W2I9_MYCAG|nr:hypothetical protein [Mycolicibacterium agri]GFG51629.1 hypothetical protein MAGR_30700 [Mycolicibacterium agri]